MSEQVEWRPKTPTESVVRYSDFADELAAGETLSSAVASATVWSGNDSNPSTILGSTTVIANGFGLNTVASTIVLGGVAGTLYQCLITGTTNLSRVITKTAILAVKPPLN